MIGKLKDRGLFMQKVSVPDGSGGTTFEWEDYYECWMSFNPMKASRKLVDNQEAMINAVEVIIWYNPDKQITKDLMLRYKDFDYTIISIVDVQDKERYYQLVVTRRQ